MILLLKTYYKHIIFSIILIGAITFIYQKGYNNGVEKQKLIQFENEELIKKHYQDLQKKAVEEALKNVKVEKEIVIKWKEKKVEVEKIINKIEYQNCKLNDEDFNVYLKNLEEIK